MDNRKFFIKKNKPVIGKLIATHPDGSAEVLLEVPIVDNGINMVVDTDPVPRFRDLTYERIKDTETGKVHEPFSMRIDEFDK